MTELTSLCFVYQFIFFNILKSLNILTYCIYQRGTRPAGGKGGEGDLAKANSLNFKG